MFASCWAVCQSILAFSCEVHLCQRIWVRHSCTVVFAPRESRNPLNWDESCPKKLEQGKKWPHRATFCWQRMDQGARYGCSGLLKINLPLLIDACAIKHETAWIACGVSRDGHVIDIGSGSKRNWRGLRRQRSHSRGIHSLPYITSLTTRMYAWLAVSATKHKEEACWKFVVRNGEMFFRKGKVRLK